MYIQTQTTPNPDTVKFLTEQNIIDSETPYDFVNEESAENSPLVKQLFAIEGVESVMLGQDFVSVTRKKEYDWTALSPLIIDSLTRMLMLGGAVLQEEDTPGLKVESQDFEKIYDAETLKTVNQIVELIETRVRPAVAADGGDILFDRFDTETGIVYLHMRGACAGCPSSNYTLKAGIERLLQHFIPEVEGVEPVL